MTNLPAIRALQPAIKFNDRRASIVGAARDRIVKLATNPDLLVVVLFCVIGLGLTLNVLARHPDVALTIDQLQLFP